MTDKMASLIAILNFSSKNDVATHFKANFAKIQKMTDKRASLTAILNFSPKNDVASHFKGNFA